jgi:hypothetical protein
MSIKQEIFRDVEKVAELQGWEAGRVWGAMKKKFGCSLADADESGLEERQVYIRGWLAKLKPLPPLQQMGTDADWMAIYEISKKRVGL